MSNGIFEFGEALAAQTLRLADMAAQEQVAPQTASTIFCVVETVANLLEASRQSFLNGDFDTGVHGLEFAEGGVRLINMLLTKPNDLLTVAMAAPFLSQNEVAA